MPAAAAVLFSVALVGGISACSSNDSTSDNATTAKSSAAAATSKAKSSESASATASSPAGGSSASVDGAALTAKFTTTCAKQGGVLALSLTDTDNATYGNLAVSATVSGDNVTAVGIAGNKGGSNGLPYALGYGQGVPGGSASVKVNGTTYHVTGEGVGAPDLTNPTAAPPQKKFDITFACSTIVGG